MAQVDTALLKPELVFFDFEAEDYRDFFKKLGEKLAPQGYLNDSWYDAIVKRESSYPTGLEFDKISVAIPHVEPENIAKPYIAVIKTKAPIPFAAMADMVDHPVQTQLIVNLGLVAHDEDQVAVLQAMMGMFMDGDAVADILSQTTGEGMVEAFKRYIG